MFQSVEGVRQLSARRFQWVEWSYRMNIVKMNTEEVIDLYAASIQELRNRGVLRTKNVVGELGEYYVLKNYSTNEFFPVLKPTSLGTKNYNAISESGERYVIKTTTGRVTGAFYGLTPIYEGDQVEKLFDYVVICKLDDNYRVEGIYQLTWESFLELKSWHKRIRAWNLALNDEVKANAITVYERGSSPKKIRAVVKNPLSFDEQDEPVRWNKTKSINHVLIKEKAAELMGQQIGKYLKQESASRFVSDDKETAVFILSSKYSQKNQEYWYSINDDIIPWLKLYPTCKIVFALGSDEDLLVFDYYELEKMFKGCLKTKEDLQKHKMAHYHISFSVENNGKVYFKQKKPERDFVDVTDHLLK